MRCICYWASFLLWFHLLIPSGVISPHCSITYQTLNDLETSSFHVISSYCSLGYQGKNAKVACQSFLWWITFCQNFPPWPIHLRWPYTAWLIVSLSYTRLWSMQSFLAIFCDEVFIPSALWCMMKRGLWKLPDGKNWLWGKLGVALMVRAMLSQSLMQFSANGWGCALSV